MIALALLLMPLAAVAGLWLTRPGPTVRRLVLAVVIHLQAGLTVCLVLSGGAWPDAPGLWHLASVNAVFLLVCWGFILSGDAAPADLLLLLAALNGMGLAPNPLMYYLALEGSLFAVWLLLGMNAIEDAALRRSLVVYSLGTGLTLAGLMVLAPGITASFAEINATVRTPLRTAVGVAVAGTGLAVCAALAPTAGWLAAMVSRLRWPAALAVTALLPGGALLGWLRLAAAAGDDGVHALMRVLGLLTMATGAYGLARRRQAQVFLVQAGIFHMGVAVFAVGVGGAGVWAGIMHGLARSLTVAILFLAGAALVSGRTPADLGDHRGQWRRHPFAAAAWLGAVLAGCGLPPFPLFASLFATATAGFAYGTGLTTGLFLLLYLAGTAALATPALAVLRGPGEGTPPPGPVRLGSVPAAIVALAAALVLGLGMPSLVAGGITRAARAVEAGAAPPPGIR